MQNYWNWIWILKWTEIMAWHYVLYYYSGFHGFVWKRSENSSYYIICIFFNGMKKLSLFSNWIIEIRTNYMALYFFIIIIIFKFDLNIVVWKTSKKVLHFSNLIIEIRTNDMNRTNYYSFLCNCIEIIIRFFNFLFYVPWKKYLHAWNSMRGSK